MPEALWLPAFAVLYHTLRDGIASGHGSGNDSAVGVQRKPALGDIELEVFPIS